ncbi:hypothetical protein PIB30_022046 [Stylosanthes scabra]|uniref:Uncharacterized protein n=1 Tax=Stylosanthes scabra TaxID=79078 RepID=A0ABU6Z6G5_9FABA|nr:hypothetical protein [Stylosanthes scabra]
MTIIATQARDILNNNNNSRLFSTVPPCCRLPSRRPASVRRADTLSSAPLVSSLVKQPLSSSIARPSPASPSSVPFVHQILRRSTTLHSSELDKARRFRSHAISVALLAHSSLLAVPRTTASRRCTFRIWS